MVMGPAAEQLSYVDVCESAQMRALFLLQLQPHKTPENCFNSLIQLDRCKMEMKTNTFFLRVLHCERKIFSLHLICTLDLSFHSNISSP